MSWVCDQSHSYTFYLSSPRIEELDMGQFGCMSNKRIKLFGMFLISPVVPGKYSRWIKCAHSSMFCLLLGLYRLRFDYFCGKCFVVREGASSFHLLRLFTAECDDLGLLDSSLTIMKELACWRKEIGMLWGSLSCCSALLPFHRRDKNFILFR